jgi:hypothetical protein
MAPSGLPAPFGFPGSRPSGDPPLRRYSKAGATAEIGALLDPRAELPSRCGPSRGRRRMDARPFTPRETRGPPRRLHSPTSPRRPSGRFRSPTPPFLFNSLQSMGR